MRRPMWTLRPHTHIDAIIILGMYFTGVSTPSWRMRSDEFTPTKTDIGVSSEEKIVSFDGREKAGGDSSDTDTEFCGIRGRHEIDESDQKESGSVGRPGN